ncbi:Linoleate 10R-lipoxygenase [Paramyrothecium foliicola]|nr:Linoleate 10R-lipoxygenase [Paramyrothecium foliicola]
MVADPQPQQHKLWGRDRTVRAPTNKLPPDASSNHLSPMSPRHVQGLPALQDNSVGALAPLPSPMFYNHVSISKLGTDQDPGMLDRSSLYLASRGSPTRRAPSAVSSTHNNGHGMRNNCNSKSHYDTALCVFPSSISSSSLSLLVVYICPPLFDVGYLQDVEHNGVTMSNGKEFNGDTAYNGFHQNGDHQNGEEKNGYRNGHQNGQQDRNGHDSKQQNVNVKSVGSSHKIGSTAGSSSGSGSLISNLRQLRTLSKRPLPTEMGDGTYRKVDKRPGILADLRSVSLADLKTVLEIVAAKVKGETQQDDKTMIMERTIQLVADLPSHSKTQEILTNDFINKLWTSLDHPPLLYMGNQFKYRQPDGSYNNPLQPKLGAAGTPYARSCKPSVVPLGAMPAPELVYESVMARDGFKKNPNNVSSILWYWATIIIHDLFWTNMEDGNINDASSYLDLAPLYGGSQEASDSVRTFKDGMLKPDCFADKRLVGNPPGVCIILIMFNRFHNHVAQNLAAINEGGRFTKPSDKLESEAAAAAWKKYDEELFQTARLVTSGLYINITLIDYVRNIIGLNRVDTIWTLDPRQEMGVSKGTKELSESGVGNAVSAEFNLCYRWHSCISEMDEKWIQDFYTELLGDGYGEMNLQALMKAVKKLEASVDKDPGKRTFNGFERGPDGKFNDDQLVDALATAIEQPGGAFGARNVPRIMKPIEMLGIIRGRKWNLAGLNEFRKHFGLKAYDTFEDINSDPQVADALRNLYQHPDFVELYPGLVAEEAKTPMDPGVGIAPTYTISRVVLSDAVSLVRGDRYYTTDYNPGHLTNWGYKEVDYDLNLNHGCVFYKLFIRAFPNHFKQDSVYAHYPMGIPPENHKILTKLNRAHLFSFDRPRYSADRINITTFGAAEYVLKNPERYKVNWQEGFKLLMGEAGGRFMLSGDSPLHTEQRQCMGSLLYQDGWKNAIKSFYSMVSERLLVEKSYKLAGQTYIDVVRDVGNLAHTHFVSRMFNLPLKSRENPRGVFSEQELYKALAVIFTCIFFDLDPAKSYPLRQAAKEAAAKLGKLVETNVKLTLSLGIRGLFTGPKPSNDPLAAYGVNLIKGLSKSGLNAQEITWSQVMPTAGAMVPNQAQVFAQALDWYLSPAGEPHRLTLHRIATQESTEETDALLLGYAMEGIRMAGTYGLYREATTTDIITEDDGRQVQVSAGDRVFVSFVDAAKDPARFPEPEKVDPRRRLESYLHYGAGPHTCLGREVSQVALIELFRALFRKRNLRRAPGPQGELKKVPRPGGFFVYMSEDWGTITPFPTSMKVTWDGE